MADNRGGRLGLMFLIGFLCIQIGLTGRLGSILAAIIDPSAMIDATPGVLPDRTGGSPIGPGPGPASGTLTAQQIAKVAGNAGFLNNRQIMAIAIALAESGGAVGAIDHDSNGSTDYGLWQINSVHGLDSAKLLTADYNASAAFSISGGGSNWGPWTTFQNGAYKKFLATAQAGYNANLGAG